MNDKNLYVFHGQILDAEMDAPADHENLTHSESSCAVMCGYKCD